MDTAEAKLRSQAAVALVAEVVSAGEVDDLEGRLPADYAELFEFLGASEDDVPR